MEASGKQQVRQQTVRQKHLMGTDRAAQTKKETISRLRKAIEQFLKRERNQKRFVDVEA